MANSQQAKSLPLRILIPAAKTETVNFCYVASFLSTYLSYCLGDMMGEIVEIPWSAWVALWVCVFIGYFFSVSDEDVVDMEEVQEIQVDWETQRIRGTKLRQSSVQIQLQIK